MHNTIDHKTFRKKRSLRFQLASLMFILASSMFNSCLNQNTLPIPNTQTESHITKTVRFLESPTAIDTDTIIPSLTASPTKMHLVNLTPLPTLSDALAEVEFHHWLAATEECKFPCWASITPGHTNWQQARQLISRVVSETFVDQINVCDSDTCNYLEWKKRGNTFIRGSIFSNREGLINRININLQEPVPSYRVDNILKIYGSPRRVFLETAYNGVMDPHNIAFYLTLAYPENNFIVNYTWSAEKKGADTVGCIQDQFTKVVISELINPQSSDEQLISSFAGIDERAYVHPLENVSNITINQFYEDFLSISGEECISTPGKYWP